MYHDHLKMGFERPRPAKLRGAAAPPPLRYRWLSDYLEMTETDPAKDAEAEHCTWPDVIDQTRLARCCGRYAFDDAEDDDPAGGDICDEPHDAREEDGQ